MTTTMTAPAPTMTIQPQVAEFSQIQAVQHVERYVHERRDTDKPLVGWGVYFFLLTWLTAFIYPLAVFYRRINRADQFRARKAHYYESLVEFTKQYAEQSGSYDAVHSQIDDLDNYVKHRFTTEHKPIKAGLSLALSLPTLGIYSFVAIAKAMRFWSEIQLTEQDFDDKLSQIWMKLGVVKYPVTFQPVQKVRRSFGIHLLLSVLTLGIYAIVWDNRLHTDPDKVYPEFHTAEDTILNAVRNAAA